MAHNGMFAKIFFYKCIMCATSLKPKLCAL